MAQQQLDRRKVRSSKQPVSIPDKLYFRIGEVSRLCSLPAYVLRFWETEFPQLKPNKGGTGQRLYRKRDVEMVLEIKHLLYDEGFTIAGARRLLAEKKRSIGGTATEGRELMISSSSTGKTHSILSGKDASSKKGTLSSTGKASAPKIKELREEMRELLTLLGSSPQDPKSQLTKLKREVKKGGRSEEPTLF